MIGFILWLMYQVASFLLFLVWYGRKHPEEFSRMVDRWRSKILRRPRRKGEA